MKRFAVCLFLCALPLGGAQAAMDVIGEGAAHVCFVRANAGHNTTRDLDVCNDALTDDLSKRDRAATFINRGVVRLALNQFDEAEADFGRGIAVEPELGEGYLNRGAAYIAMKRFADAMTDIDKGLGLGVSRPAVGYYDRAIANEALGNNRAAYDDYQKVLALEPDFLRAREQLKRFHIVQKPDS
ncbi:MAG: hypothetical protein JO348_12520 [Alphaproteobacteria bacterium]|nr:hypothetical protein [Alphaproteobacteria bacterium]